MDEEHGGWFVPELGTYVPGPHQSGIPSFDINCRCRTTCRVKGIKDTQRRVKGEGIIPYKSYDEWLEEKALNIKTNDKYLERKISEYQAYKIKYNAKDYIHIDTKGKLDGYALNPNHPRGGDKAKVFMAAFGYEQDDGELLATEIMSNLIHSKIEKKEIDNFGRRYRAYVPITGKNGHKEIIEVGFIVDGKDSKVPIRGKARLNSAFLRGRKNDKPL